MASIRSLKILCARSITLNELCFDTNEIPSDLHPLIDRFQNKIYPGDEVQCPKCKEWEMTFLPNDNDYSDGKIECMGYLFWSSARPWMRDEDVFKYICQTCEVLALTCPKCSVYETKEEPMLLSESKFVLLKYLGFRSDGSESLPPRPNRRPNKEDLDYDDARNIQDYDNAPILPKDDIDSIETEADFEYIDYYRGHEQRNYATDEDLSTGHSGGETVYWRCEFCDYLVEMTDK